MDSSDSDSCDSVSSRLRCKRRRLSAASHSCGGWHVDTGSLTPEMLRDVGLALIDDVIDSGASLSVGEGHGGDAMSALPTPPNSQLEPASSAGEWGRVLDSYSTELDGYIPGDFVTYKKQKLCDNTGADPFARLSDELLLKVFAMLRRQYVARCARVCRRWRHLTADESLWRRVDAGGRTFSPGQLGRLVQRGVRTLRLARAEISAPIFCDPLTLQQSDVFSCRLQHLDLSMAAITAQGVEQLLSACRRLLKLSLERCHVTELSCRHLADNCELQVLNCSLATGLTYLGLSHILSKCCQLEELNVGWCELDERAVHALVSLMPRSARKLNMSGTKNSLSDEHVELLMTRVGRHLKVLDLSDAGAISRRAYTSLFQHLTAIEHLSLSRCYQLPGIRCTDLSRLAWLTHLDMFGCFSESGVRALRSALPSLHINTRPLSTVARPTVGVRRTSIWQLSVSQP